MRANDLAGPDLFSCLMELAPDRRREELARLSAAEQRELRHRWPLFARPDQLPPPGDWRTWLIMAGRGFGKTRAGAEWVRAVARTTPDARIALVGGSLGDARAVMIEGESGLLNIAPPASRPQWEPSLRRLTWPNGAIATLYSAQEPEALRGPQHSHACWPGAEGNLRQRSAGARGCVAALRSRRQRADPSFRRRRWRSMAGRGPGNRGMVGPRWCDCLPSGGQLAVRHAAGRHADL